MSIIVCDIVYVPGRRGNQREERIATAQGLVRRVRQMVAQNAHVPEAEVEVRLASLQTGGEHACDIEVHVRPSIRAAGRNAVALQALDVEELARIVWTNLSRSARNYVYAAIDTIVVAVWKTAPYLPVGAIMTIDGDITSGWGCALEAGMSFHVIDPVV